MKKRLLNLIIPAVLALCMIAGCGGKSISAEEYVRGIYKMMINMDFDEAKSLGMSDGDIKTYKETVEKSVTEYMNNMNESFRQQFGIGVDETLLNETGQEYLNAMKKLTVKTSEESGTDKEVKVKVSTTVLDMPAVTADAMSNAQSKVKASDYTTADEYFKALLPVYVTCLRDGLAGFTPSEETATVTVTVTKDGNKWKADLSELGKSIADAAVKKAN